MNGSVIEIYSESTQCVICSKQINLTKDGFMCTKNFHGDDVDVTSEFEYVFGKHWNCQNLVSDFICHGCSQAVKTLFTVKQQLLTLFKKTNNLNDAENFKDAIGNAVNGVKKVCFKSSVVNTEIEQPVALDEDITSSNEDQEIISNLQCDDADEEYVDGNTTHVQIDQLSCLPLEIDDSENNSESSVPKEIEISKVKTKKKAGRKKREVSEEEKLTEKVCPVCGKVYQSRFTMRTHLKTHYADKSFSCTICGKLFAFEYYLTKHMKRHNAPKKYSCAYCEKSFKDMWCLKAHERIHTGEKPFNCGSCEKRFTTIDKLRIHERLHTQHRPYKCNFCDRCFNERAVCARHQLSIHLKMNPFPCKQCGQGFNSQSQLTDHKKTHRVASGATTYVCNVCGKIFADEGQLNAHHISEHVSADGK